VTLTDRQRQVLEFVSWFKVEKGYCPSTRDIQEHFGFASQTAAVNHLRALERKGRIRTVKGIARSIVVV
jgi:repressor LexA